MKPLHIVHCIPTLLFGGAERAVVDLVNASDPKYFRYTLLLFVDAQPLAAELIPGRATVIVVPKTNRLGVGLRTSVRRILKELKPDIVHTHTFSADVWGRLAAHDLGIPVVTTEHNVNYDEGWVRSFIKRCLARYSVAYAACSTSVRNFVVQKYGVSLPVEVIPWGIPLERFAYVNPPRFESPLKLLVLGRLAPQKGHVHLFDALATLRDRPWQLSVVGDGPLHRELVGRVKGLGLTDRVVFLPATRDVPQVMAAHDIVIVPSLWEGYGIVAMEAMAAGRLVVASDVGGLKDLIRDQETGFLAKPTADDLTRILDAVLQNPSFGRRVAQQAEDYAYTHFDIRYEVVRYEALYRSVVYLPNG